MAKRPRQDNQSGDEAPFRGEEPSAARALARGIGDIQQATGVMVRYAAAFDETVGPLIDRGNQRGIDRAARECTAEAGRRRQLANNELQAAKKLFRLEIANVAPVTAVRQAVRQFDRHIRDAQSTIALYHKISLASIKRMRFLALRNLKAGAGPFVLPSFPNLEIVWRDNQRHNIRGVVVPVTKVKFNLRILGLKLNFAVAQFRPEGVPQLPPPKLLVPAKPVVVGGRTTTALDSPGPEAGNLVVPAAGGNPAVDFYGYLKIIYVTGVPPECTIRFQTIATPRRYLLVNGAWVDLLPVAGQPRADPPGGGPNINVGGGTWVFSDFPNGGIPNGAPVCTYRTVNDLFRTWVVEFCPGALPNILGYWEWSFRQVLHMTATGVVSVTIPPAPAGVAAPPGGWPNAPGSGPTTWVDANAAPADAAAEHKALFPESYL
ncbi:MAG: hypothetical protein FJW40_10410 [Acidobacteria bacterium]|nr:hypothetical protein [Acidobacteriota bacterium]